MQRGTPLHQIRAQDRSRDLAVTDAQWAVDVVEDWSKDWKLNLNASKSEVPFFSTWTHKANQIPTVFIGGTPIPLNLTQSWFPIRQNSIFLVSRQRGSTRCIWYTRHVRFNGKLLIGLGQGAPSPTLRILYAQKNGLQQPRLAALAL